MEKVLFVIFFGMIVALLYAVYIKRDRGTHENETDTNVQGLDEEKKIETPQNEDETPVNTGSY